MRPASATGPLPVSAWETSVSSWPQERQNLWSAALSAAHVGQYIGGEVYYSKDVVDTTAISHKARMLGGQLAHSLADRVVLLNIQKPRAEARGYVPLTRGV